ncbi:alpha/beta hydrolase [Bifidobacterium thermophilum]|uniref:alpha/beta hydrolase n=1 Tax=Bifidobacterium thermophilum TaxID=33905 RepID=UPI0030B2CD14
MAHIRYESALGATPQFDFGNPRSADWSEFDGDLAGCGYDDHAIQVIRDTRLAFARSDMPRSRYWSVPEDIDMITDIPYLDDGVRGHLLDLYLPHDAVVRQGHAYPVYIDIHGGGFVYGYKELNRNFNVTLAHHGFAVFSLNYRPAPQTDFIGQLRDISAGISWIAAHGDAYPIDLGNVFLTGDSAGGALAFYQAALQGDPAAAAAYGVAPSGLPIRAVAAISGVFDLSPFTAQTQRAHPYDIDRPDDVVSVIGPQFFKRLSAIDPAYRFSTDLVRNSAVPPMFLATSSDDMIEYESLALATALSRAHKDFELHDVKTQPGKPLGHVYSVCMSWLEESETIFRLIHDFSYRLLS